MSDTIDLLQCKARLLAMVRRYEPGQCKIMSEGDACTCGLCDVDRLAEVAIKNAAMGPPPKLWDQSMASHTTPSQEKPHIYTLTAAASHKRGRLCEVSLVLDDRTGFKRELLRAVMSLDEAATFTAVLHAGAGASGGAVIFRDVVIPG